MQESQNTKVGQANELWVRLAWARKQVVLLDKPSALRVLVRNAMGLGMVGSLHMAQKNEFHEYKKQMVKIVETLDKTPHDWEAVVGDWNQDIQSHKETIGTRLTKGRTVAYMTGRQHLPKNFFVMSGIHRQHRGVWLSPLGDHPMVWVKGEVELAMGASQSDTKPITPMHYEEHHNVMFSDIVEAFSGGRNTPQQWIHMIREAVVIVDRELRNEPDTKIKEDKETIRRIKRVVQGKG